jgi:hypothetical protein
VPPIARPRNVGPHQDPHNTPAAQLQISDFLAPNHAVMDVCGGRPRHSYDYTL